ncbi:MAG: AAA family ATPase [Lachnospiraceae bacterium]|nr:AAA family ATPase [Lachnospiraceae bacterium]
MFKRKIYDELIQWKEKSNGSTALMIEGARRIGKSTIVEAFAANAYDDYLLIDFSVADKAVVNNFENIGNLNEFFRNLALLTGKRLKEKNSLIIFDEVQFCPKARQSIKQLVKDGRYDYIETGSLISISENVKDILIPSEEDCIKMFPMDFEEFLWAIGNNVYADEIRNAFESRKSLGDAAHRKIMQAFRTYMAVGGMPQAVQNYVDGKDYYTIDRTKKNILKLYSNDLKKHDDLYDDNAGIIFKTLPAQLSNRNSVFHMSEVNENARLRNCKSAIDFLSESMIVNICTNVTKPEVGLELYKDISRFKMFMGDTGLLISHILQTGKSNADKLYRSLIIDDLGINQGMVFENAVAQMLMAGGHELYYHEFSYRPENSTIEKNYEIDFLLVKGKRLSPVEVKSSSYRSHKSFDYFKDKYQLKMNERYIIYTKDLEYKDDIMYIPVYMAMCL